jgi:hypothetical protein
MALGIMRDVGMYFIGSCPICPDGDEQPLLDSHYNGNNGYCTNTTFLWQDETHCSLEKETFAGMNGPLK